MDIPNATPIRNIDKTITRVPHTRAPEGRQQRHACARDGRERRRRARKGRGGHICAGIKNNMPRHTKKPKQGGRGDGGERNGGHRGRPMEQFRPSYIRHSDPIQECINPGVSVLLRYTTSTLRCTHPLCCYYFRNAQHLPKDSPNRGNMTIVRAK